MAHQNNFQKISLALLPLFFVTLFSCSHHKKIFPGPETSYSEAVKIIYDKAEKYFKEKNYEKAAEHYRLIKGSYHFSDLATLSELRLADIKFAQEKWVDASSLYEIFIRMHPRHPKTHYAYFQAALSLYNLVPQSPIIKPEIWKRDITPVKNALEALERFLPQSVSAEKSQEASEMIEILQQMLLKKEIDVANYYLKSGKFEAAARRFIAAYNTYSTVKNADSCLFFAAEIFEHKLKNIAEALFLYQKITELSSSTHKEQAKEKIKELSQ